MSFKRLASFEIDKAPSPDYTYPGVLKEVGDETVKALAAFSQFHSIFIHFKSQSQI